jgi:c(7)-type cytochrome triheme protein
VRPTGGITRAAVTLVVLGAAGAALAAAFPATLRLPRRDPGRAPGVPAALFSHRSHAALGCQACHPTIFPQAPLAFTHEDMKAGKYCGACHDGGIAFAISGAACGGCHASGR